MSKISVSNRGFTLIELLVVIAIVSLLSSIAMVSFQKAMSKARDAKRKSDINQIAKALEIYYDILGRYPTETVCDTSKGSGASPCIALFGADWNKNASNKYIGWAVSVRTPVIFPALPVDSINRGEYYYKYEPNADGNGSCVSSKCCAFYVNALLEDGTVIFEKSKDGCAVKDADSYIKDIRNR